ncbi:hypothetical protein C8R46DRAFT_379545 [Mycena filopes]|nr:hypothetical protein C8R46DRAFT_379545 [Mycena filopes]
MGIELTSPGANEQTRAPRFLDTIYDIVRAFVLLFYPVWIRLIRHAPQVSELSSKTPLLDCEKGYVDEYQSRAQLIAALQRRDAADAAFEAQVHALLAPVKQLLAEINPDSGIHHWTSTPWADRISIHLSLDTPQPHDRGTRPDLPPAPQIFYGREQELAALVDTFTPPRQAHVTLAGVEGAGSSTLALAFLHRPEVVRTFGTRRFLVRCTHTADGDVPALASALGLPNPTLALATLAACPLQTLVVLDGVRDTTIAMLTALAQMRNVSLLLTTCTPAATRRLDGFTEIQVGPLSLPAARALFRGISDLPLGRGGDVRAAPALLEVPADLLPPPAQAAEETSIHCTEAADAALVDALLQHAGCLPRAVGELARRAQYEPLPFLFGCLEEEDLEGRFS